MYIYIYIESKREGATEKSNATILNEEHLLENESFCNMLLYSMNHIVREQAHQKESIDLFQSSNMLAYICHPPIPSILQTAISPYCNTLQHPILQIFVYLYTAKSTSREYQQGIYIYIYIQHYVHRRFIFNYLLYITIYAICMYY